MMSGRESWGYGATTLMSSFRTFFLYHVNNSKVNTHTRYPRLNSTPESITADDLVFQQH
jgi:hypothetical protein